MKTLDFIPVARPPTKKDFLSRQDFASRLLKHLISEGLFHRHQVNQLV
ncbi:hypothetical protein NSTC731_02616 [Nostoc sp. DSM 114167]|jgi:hypothetical protein